MRKWIFILSLILSSQAIAEVINFSNFIEARQKWLSLKKPNAYTAKGINSLYENAVALAFDNIRESSDWEIVKETNYIYSNVYQAYVNWPIGKKIVQAGQAPYREKEVKHSVYYFVQKKGVGPESRLVLIQSGTNSLMAYYNEAKHGQKYVDEIREIISNGIIRVYKNKVLEFRNSVGFYKGVDELDHQWNEFIFDPQDKAKIIDSIDNFVNKFDLEVWRELNLPLNRGILLYGPPGTGKSFIAKVLMSNIMKKRYQKKITYIHVSARNITSQISIRNIYQIARELSPSIVFFEDIDLIAGTDRADRADVKNELMQQLSGLEKLEGVLTIGTTNLFHLIDSALKRSKRLGFHFEVGKPSLTERIQLFELFLKNHVHADVDATEWAAKTEGFTGADIKELVELAAEEAFRNKSYNRNNVLILKDDFLSKTHQLKLNQNVLIK